MDTLDTMSVAQLEELAQRTQNALAAAKAKEGAQRVGTPYEDADGVWTVNASKYAFCLEEGKLRYRGRKFSWYSQFQARWFRPESSDPINTAENHRAVALLFLAAAGQ